MNSTNIKRGLLLTGIVVGCLALIFAQRPFLPLAARFATATAIVLTGMAVFFAAARARREFALAVASSVIVAVEGSAIYFFLHVLILKDSNTPGMLGNHVVLVGVGMASPFVVGRRARAAAEADHA